MPLELHRGPAFGAADRIARERWLERGGLLVVGDRDLAVEALRHAGPLVIDRRAVTLAGLRAEVLRAAGRADAEPISPIRARLALQEIVQARIWPGFGPATQAPGFISALARALTELRAGGLTPARVTAAARGAGAVAEDMAAVYSDAAGVGLPIDAAWEAVAATRSLRAFAPLSVAGFDDLDPPTWALLHALGRIADVVVGLVYEPERRAYDARHARQREWATRAGAVTDHLAEPRDARPPELVALDGAFGQDRPGVASAGPAIRFAEAAGTVGMYRAALEELLAAYRQGTALGRCALVVPHLASARDDLDRLLADWAIPARRRTRVRFMETPIGGALAALLRLGDLEADDPNAIGPLFGWLRSPYSGAPEDEIDRFEAAARRGDATTRSQLMARYGEAPMRAARAAVAAASGGPRQQVALLLAAASEGLRRAAGHPARLSRADRLDAAALAALGGVAAGLTEEDATPDPDPRPAGPLPPGALGQILADLTIADEEGPADGLWVGDYAALRGRRFSVVAVTGLDGDGIPGRPAPDPLLADLRAPLADRLNQRAPGTSEHRLRFLQAIAAAGKSLILVRRIVDDDGREVAPSPYWFEALRIAGRRLGDADRAAGARGEIADAPATAPSEREALRAMAFDGQVVPGALADAVGRRTRSLGVSPHAFDHVERLSVTAVEQLSRCRYGWLLQSYLRPRELDNPWGPMDEGSLLHKIMERLFAAGIAEGLGALSPTTLDAYRTRLGHVLGEVFSAPAPPSAGPAYAVFAERAGIVLERLLVGLAELNPAFSPLQVEQKFRDVAILGEHDPPLALSGKADRIDGSDGWALAIDYKRSGADFRPDRPVADRLQLPLYAEAAARALSAESGREHRSAGGLYVGLTTGAIAGAVAAEAGFSEHLGSKRIIPEAAWRQIVAEAVAMARAAAETVRAGRLDAPPTEPCCGLCGRDGRWCGALWR